jgi:hypothetical protein
MNLKRAGRVVIVLGAVCGAGLSSAAAATTSQTVAWGTTSSAPAGSRAELFGVASASAADVLAVGGFNPGQPPTAVLTKPYAERWNGTGWTATRVPLGSVYPPPAVQAAQLTGVADIAPGDGWAVGSVSDISSLASKTLAFHWDGTAWRRTPTPSPGGPASGNQLDAVAGRAANDVWAVGGDGYPAVSLVLHWNGSAWAQVSVPDIGSLDAVTLAPGHVWVAGGDSVEQFDGTAWTSLPAPPSPAQTSVSIAGLAHNASGLWAVGAVEFTCGEGGTCTAPYAALWNATTWTVVLSGGNGGISGVVAAGSKVLAASGTGVLRLTPTGAVPQVTPALSPLQLTAIAADPAGNPWAVGWTAASGTVRPAIINAPGIGQGGIIVTTGASAATVTWTGPVNGTGSTDPAGRYATGGLPDGTYTITASLPGCQPAVATAVVTAGIATALHAHPTCPP